MTNINLRAPIFLIQAALPWISSELSDKYIDSLSPDGSARGALNSLHPVGRTGTPRGIGDVVCIPGQPELQLRYRTGAGCRWWKDCSVAHVYEVRRKTMFLVLGLLARYGRWE